MATPLPPRHLFLKALAKASALEEGENQGESSDIEIPPPGYMRTLSFYQPGLIAGQDYTITVNQGWKLQGASSYSPLDITTDGEYAAQKFSVVAPQFAIPTKDFHSTYPPQGQADQPSIAPHIVLNDPDLPWERDINQGRAKTPWLAVFPFDVNRSDDPELKHEPGTLRRFFEELRDVGDPELPADDNLLKQLVSGTCTIQTTLSKYHKISSHRTAVEGATFRRPAHDGFDETDEELARLKAGETPEETGSPKDEAVQLILLKGDLFKKLFCPSGSTTPDIDQFQYCAHVRSINTEGISDAGVSDKGVFSVIHSRRSGPTDIADNSPPRSQAVHLLSLEGVEEMSDVTNNQIVVMISLYRWTYLCQPPVSVNFVDAMRDIGIQIKYSQLSENEKVILDKALKGANGPSTILDQVNLAESELADVDANMMETPPGCYLRCPRSVVKALQPQSKENDGKLLADPLDEVRKKMVARLENGYSLVRYRVQTGEETVGLFRGALLPVYPRAPPDFWPLASTNGQDYQIFGRDLGLVDISYSSAWNLGRMLATSDALFVSALMRVRTRAYQAGLRASGLISAQRDLGLTTKGHFFSALPDTLDTLVHTSRSSQNLPQISLEKRWKRENAKLDMALNLDAFAAGIEKAIGDEGSADGTDRQPILDIFKPTSEDWRIIHDWILDRMYLAKIPTHYLIPDPSYLPPESIRFFHIDNNWMDCFIDGALSCANHTPLNQQDAIRATIKDQFNLYLDTEISKNPTSLDGKKLTKPQVPIFGFFLRSAVVSTFQDLIFEAPFSISTDAEASSGKAPILVQRKLAPDLVMVLLDRIPDAASGEGGMSEIKYIKIAQPPHQQRFAVADFLDEKTATMLFRKLDYEKTVNEKPKNETEFLDPAGAEINFENPWVNLPLQHRVYDWQTRCLNPKNVGRLFFPPVMEEDVYTNEAIVGKDAAANVKLLREAFLPDKFPEGFETQWFNSAFLGLQLNDTAKYLQILPPPTGEKVARRPYRIRTLADIEKPESLKVIREALRTISERRHDGSSTVEMKLKPLALRAEKEAVPESPLQPAVVPSASLLRAFSTKVKGAIGSILHDSDSDEDNAVKPEHSFRQRVKGLGHSLSRKKGLAQPQQQPAAPQAASLATRVAADDTPNYKFRIFPREDRLPTDDELKYVVGRQTIQTEGYVNTNDNHAVDLVVSLRRSAVPRDKPLQEVKIVFPLGPAAARLQLQKDKEKAGLNSADVILGPGFAPVGGSGVRARMLSNQRWVVVLDESELHLTVRVIPRPVRAWDMVSTPQNKELGFMITGVENNWQSVPAGQREAGKGLIKVSITETYGKGSKGDQGTAQQSGIEVQKRNGA